MITAIVSAIGGPISSVVSGWLDGTGVWRMWPQNLVLTQVGMPGNGVPWALPGMLWMVCSEVILSLLFANGLPSKGQVTKLGPAICVGSGWGFGQKEIGDVGHTVGSEFKAQMDLGTTVPYSFQILHGSLSKLWPSFIVDMDVFGSGPWGQY